MEDYSSYYSIPQRKRSRISINYGKVTLALVIICIAAYIFVPEEWYYRLMYNSDMVSVRPWILITNAFLHANLFHLGFNCFGLFIFGTLLEKRHGSMFIVLLFFVSVILGNLLFGIFNPGMFGLGISGYVYALIGAAVVLEPRARVIFPIGYFYTTAPVSIAGPIMFLGEIVFSFINADGVGHVAHVAGFAAGLLLAFIQKRRAPPKYNYTIKY